MLTSVAFVFSLLPFGVASVMVRSSCTSADLRFKQTGEKVVEVYLLNAFTDTVDGGNPAGVVLNADNMTDDEMLRVAHDVGYSETAFVQSSSLADFKVRFFTPAAEVDLCGHATIATFSLLFQLKTIQAEKYFQETRAGVLDVDIDQSAEVFMTQSEPLFDDYVDATLIAQSLNIGTGDLNADFRPQIISTGLRDIIIPVRDLKTLLAIRPDFAKVSEVSKQLDVVGYQLFSMENLHGGNAHSRNFAPLYGIDEEAATGSATGAMACYLFEHKMIDAEQAASLVFEQGYSMKRPSRIKAKLDIYDGGINRVEVGGRAFLIGKTSY